MNPANETKFQELVAFTQEAMQRLHVPGAAIGLYVDGEEYLAGLGVTSVENPLPVTPETLFQIGSTTKTVTTTALLRLVEAGRLSLDDKVRQYLPDFKVKDEAAAAGVTIRQLLNHTSGWIGDYFKDTGDGDDALEKYVASMADLDQATPLGALYTYNNAAFNVAGRVIEVITGKTYEAAIRELVLEPLGMTNSFFFPGEVMLRRFAVGHALREDTPIVARPWEMNRCEAPCGGLVSDLHDQLKYARFHLDGGINLQGERLLSAASVQLMQTPSVRAGDEGWIGLNWFVADIEGVRFVSHGGSTIGQQSAFWFVPAKNLALNVFTNLDQGGTLHGKVTKWVRERFLGVVEKEPTPCRLPDEKLAEYVGGYVLKVTGDLFEFKPVEGGLEMRHTLGDYSALTDTPPEPMPVTRAASFDEDWFIFTEGQMKGEKFEFLRDPQGKVVWLRFGGRVLAKQ